MQIRTLRPVEYLSLLHIELHCRDREPFRLDRLDQLVVPHPAAEAVEHLDNLGLIRPQQHAHSGNDLGGTAKTTEEGRAVLVAQRHVVRMDLETAAKAYDGKIAAEKTTKRPRAMDIEEWELRAAKDRALAETIRRLQRDVFETMPLTMAQRNVIAEDGKDVRRILETCGSERSSGLKPREERVRPAIVPDHPVPATPELDPEDVRTKAGAVLNSEILPKNGPMPPPARPRKPDLTTENALAFIGDGSKRRGDIARYFGVQEKRIDRLLNENAAAFDLGATGWVKVAKGEKVGAAPRKRV